MAKVKKGMSIEEVRQVWLPLAQAKSQEFMDKYYARSEHSGGREGLGVYGLSKERAAREKVRLAVKLLKQAGLEITFSSIGRVTGQSRSTIANYWAPPLDPPDSSAVATDSETKIIKFPGPRTPE